MPETNSTDLVRRVAALDEVVEDPPTIVVRPHVLAARVLGPR